MKRRATPSSRILPPFVSAALPGIPTPINASVHPVPYASDQQKTNNSDAAAYKCQE